LPGPLLPLKLPELVGNYYGFRSLPHLLINNAQYLLSLPLMLKCLGQALKCVLYGPFSKLSLFLEDLDLDLLLRVLKEDELLIHQLKQLVVFLHHYH
jgi:hypothetical protein